MPNSPYPNLPNYEDRRVANLEAEIDMLRGANALLSDANFVLRSLLAQAEDHKALAEAALKAAKKLVLDE